MKTPFWVGVLAALAVTSAGCGKSEEGVTVTGSMPVLMGASTGTSALAAHALTTPANGSWILSPDKAQITFSQIQFQNAAGGSGVNAPFSNDCTVTYDRSKTSGSTLLDCPFTLTNVVPGTSFNGVIIYNKPTVKILVNDATTGFFTDPSLASKLTTTSPSGGGQYVDYTINGDFGGSDPSSEIYFTTPFTISEGSTPKIRVITDMIHTVKAAVSGGVPTFDANNGGRPVSLTATTAATGHSEYYGTAGTVGNFLILSAMTIVRVFYSDATPDYVEGSPNISNCGNGTAGAWAANPDKMPVLREGMRTGGYLGIDSNSIISWVLPKDQTFTTYAGLYEMAQVTTVGGTTLLKCQAMTSVPAPTSGDTYASGAPAITPSNTITVTLLAK